MKLKLLILITALAFSLSLQADDTKATSEMAAAAGTISASEIKPISATQKVQLTTVVEAIDREARTVTLKGPQGNTRTLQAREDSNNIDQIEVGDLVNVEYVQHMSIEVFSAEGVEPGAGVMGATAANEEGDTPGVMELATTVVTAVVEEINIEDNTFKLRWPEGEVMEYVAQEPENLKKAKVGDLVVTTYTEAIALYMNEVPAE